MAIQAVVEVLPTEVLVAARGADDVEGVLRATQDGGVERAAPEVIDGDVLTDGKALVGEVQRRGDRLGHELGRVEAGRASRLAQPVQARRAPPRRVRESNDARRLPAATADRLL